MTLIPGIRRLFRLGAGRSTALDDAAEELRLHLELRAEELIAEGMTPESARAEALRRFGDVSAIQRSLDRIDREAERAHRRGEWLDALWGDLRQGLRSLRRNPGFAVGAILTLSLGIGLNTAIFSVYNGAVLRPLPYAEPQRIVRVWSSQLSRGLRFFSVSAPDFNDWRAQSKSFDGLAAYERQRDLTLTGDAEPEQVQGARVSAELFALLGVRPILGRLFSAAEDRAGAGRPVVLGYGLWQRRFGGSRDVLGKVLTLSGDPASVVGIMPRGFALPGNSAELWEPLGKAGQDDSRGNHFLRVLGRLRPGVTLAAAREELNTISLRLQAQYPVSNASWGITLLSLTDSVLGEDFHSAVNVLVGAVALVLLIACANVATMILARNSARSRELAVRAALGAGAGRLGRLLLAEGLVLGVAGGVIGTALAYGMVLLLHALEPPNLPRLEEVTVNGTVLLVAALLAVGSGIVFGLVPLRRTARTSLTPALREGGRGLAGSRQRHRTQRVLVVAQMTLAILLLSGAGLLIRSLLQLQSVELGFTPRSVLVVDLALPRNKYPSIGSVAALYDGLLTRARALPGVREAAAVNSVPLGGPNAVLAFAVEGRGVPDPQATPDADYRSVTPGYFHLMEIPLLRGRDFTERDDTTGARVVIISANAAQRFWPKEEAVGSRIRIGDVLKGPLVEVIGVVGDVRHLSLEMPEQRPLLYFPLRRTGQPAMSVLLKTAGEPTALTGAITNQLHALDPAQPVSAFRTLDEVVTASYSRQRFNVVVLGIFAATALLLAGIGLYGVMAYTVTQRTHELGVRLALGAARGAVLRMVLGESLRLVVTGILLGLGGSLLLGRSLTALLFGVKPGDPLALLVASLILLGIALLGSYLPARRAASVDPMETLREQ